MIILATDHAGFAHKEALKAHLTKMGYELMDIGTDSDQSCDYPNFMIPAAEQVADDPSNNRAVIFGGSGQGEAMAANRIKGVRAAVYYGGPAEIIELSRTHNNANVLSIGARFVSIPEMLHVVDRWLAIDFSADERHVRRIRKIDELS